MRSLQQIEDEFDELSKVHGCPDDLNEAQHIQSMVALERVIEPLEQIAMFLQAIAVKMGCYLPPTRLEREEALIMRQVDELHTLHEEPEPEA